MAGKANGKGKRVGRLSANATLSSKGPSTQHQHHTIIIETCAFGGDLDHLNAIKPDCRAVGVSIICMPASLTVKSLWRLPVVSA